MIEDEVENASVTLQHVFNRGWNYKTMSVRNSGVFLAFADLYQSIMHVVQRQFFLGLQNSLLIPNPAQYSP